MIARRIAYHGTTLGALSLTGIYPLKTPFEPLMPGVRHVSNTNRYRRPHGESEAGVHAVPAGRAARRDRAGGPRLGGRRVHGAGAELGRHLHPARGLLPGRAGDLRRVRHAAGGRRGDLRLRPAGRVVRIDALRHPARHRHLRQGRRLGACAAGRRADDRQRGGDRSWRDDHAQPRHHLRRPPRVGGRGAQEPRGDGARGRARQRAAQRVVLPGAARRSWAKSRSWATCAAPATSGRWSWSRTRTPRRRSTTRSPTTCCAASCRDGCGTRG